MIDLKGLEEELKEDLHKVESLTQLQGIKAKYIGKSGFITQAIANIKNVPPEERREYGQRVNKLKEYAEDRTCNRWNHSGHSQCKQGEDTEDKEGKREGMVGKEEKEDSSERQWEGSGV